MVYAIELHANINFIANITVQTVLSDLYYINYIYSLKHSYYVSL